MTGPKAPLSRAEMALTEVKDATRELNAAIAEGRELVRDLRALMEEAVTVMPQSAEQWRKQYEDSIRAEWEKGLETYHNSLQASLNESVEAITRRLSKIIDGITQPVDTPLGRMSFEQFFTSGPPPGQYEAPPKMPGMPNVRLRKKKR